MMRTHLLFRSLEQGDYLRGRVIRRRFLRTRVLVLQDAESLVHVLQRENLRPQEHLLACGHDLRRTPVICRHAYACETQKWLQLHFAAMIQ